jgi:glycosyltransferase involved in cell wall biosynthesis
MAEKRKLRIKYGLDVDQPVVLHVGHLEPDRNLTALTALPSAGMQVVVAGSLYMGIHEELITRLESAGLIILRGFQPHVEELYKLADCYIFPLPPGNSITMPLSVLEAMACNLPVITTRFSGLVQAFAQGNGIRYLESEENVLEVVHEVLRSGMPVLTRDLVIPYSWPAIAARLQAHYERLLNQ